MLDFLGPEIEVLMYLKDAGVLGWDTTRAVIYERFGEDIVDFLLVESYIRYGQEDTFVLTDRGERTLKPW